MENYKGIIAVALPAHRLTQELRETIRQAGDGREVVGIPHRADAEAYLDKIEIGFGDIPFALIPRMPHLAWVQLWSAGADWLQTNPEVIPLPFQLTTTSGMHRQSLAEHIFSLLLAWNRRLPKAFAAQTQRRWVKVSMEETAMLSGKTMLILGYGAIGERTAEIALAFGMKVIGIRRHPDKKSNAGSLAADVRVEAASKLSQLLPEADVVVNILPLTPETRAAFGKKEFAAMKHTALYVNAGRGATTDESALIEALRNKTIAGALLDVTETEPLPPESPLWDMENVILTGHYAGFQPGYDQSALEIALENLGRYIRGEQLRNLVDKNAGY
jgi:phosphoglycerate dehydrogenase-like enzyme